MRTSGHWWAGPTATIAGWVERRTADRRMRLLILPLIVTAVITERLGGNVILPLEFAGAGRAAQDILDQAERIANVRWSLVADFALIAAYVTVLVAGATRASRRIGGQVWEQAGEWVAQAVVLAGLLDIVENALLLTLSGPMLDRSGAAVDLAAGFATMAASVKFILGTAAVLFILLARARSLSDPPKGATRSPLIGFALLTLLVGMAATGQLSGQLQGMHVDGDRSVSVADLQSATPGKHGDLLCVWAGWETAILGVPDTMAETTAGGQPANEPTCAEQVGVTAAPSPQFSSVLDVLRWRLGVAGLVVVPAATALLVFIMLWARQAVAKIPILDLRHRSAGRMYRRLTTVVPLLVLIEVVRLVLTLIVFRLGPDGHPSAAGWALLATTWIWRGLLLAVAVWAVPLLGMAGGFMLIETDPRDGHRRLSLHRTTEDSRPQWRGIVALRFPIGIVVLLGLLLLDILPVSAIRQFSDVLRTWDLRAAIVVLLLSLGLAVMLWVAAIRTMRDTGALTAAAPPSTSAAHGVPRQAKVEEMSNLQPIVAWGIVGLGTLQLLLSLVGLTGRSLLIPGVFVVACMLYSIRTSLTAEVSGFSATSTPADRYAISRWVPRFLAAAVFGIVGLGVIRAAVPAVAYVDTAVPGTPITMQGLLQGDLIEPWLLVVGAVLLLIGVLPTVKAMRDGLGVAAPAHLFVVLSLSPLLLFVVADTGGIELSASWLLGLGIGVTYLALGVYYFLDPDFNILGSRPTNAQTIAQRLQSDMLDPKRKSVVARSAAVGALLSLVALTVWIYIQPIRGARAVGTIGILLLAILWLAVITEMASWYVEHTAAPALLSEVFRLRRTPVLTLFVVWLVILNIDPGGFFTLDGFHDVPVVQASTLPQTATAGLDGPGCTEWADERERITASDASPATSQVGIQAAFDRWRCANGVPLNGGTARTIPLVLVSSWGGGIRAAAWSALVMDCLFSPGQAPAVEELAVDTQVADDPSSRDDVCPSRGVDPRRVFALSGVSGGSLGFVSFAANRLDIAEGRATGTGRRPEDWVQLRLGQDFLSPVAGRMVLADLPIALLGGMAGVDDRGDLLERAWESAWDDSSDSPDGSSEDGNRWLEAGLIDSWTDSLDVPLIVSNGTSYTDGCSFNASALNASVTRNGRDDCTTQLPFEDFDTDDDPVTGELVATRDLADYLAPGEDVSLSTAALLSARFAYVSPSGRVLPPSQRGHDVDPDVIEPPPAYVIDGGYHEGSATLTATQLYQALQPIIQRHNATSEVTVVPFMIHLENGYAPVNAPSDPSPPNELVVPLFGGSNDRLVTNARARAALLFSQPMRRPDGSALDVVRGEEGVPLANRYGYLTTRAHPGVQAPLGWTLSDEALEDLRRQLVANRAEIAEIAGWLDGSLRVDRG